MKKYFMGFALGFLVATATPTLAEGGKFILNSVNLRINGQTVSQPTILYNNTTYVPLRVVSESLGLPVGWDQKTKTVSVSNDKSLSKSEDNLPTQTVKDDWINEFGSITINGKTFSNCLIISKENMAYMKLSSVYEVWPEVKDFSGIDSVRAISHQGITYLEFGDLLRFLKENSVKWDFKINTSKPPSNLKPTEPIITADWIKEFGAITRNNIRYNYCLIVSKEEMAYININKATEIWPEIQGQTGLDQLDVKEYEGTKYIELGAFLGFLKERGINWDFKISSSKPPKNLSVPQ